MGCGASKNAKSDVAPLEKIETNAKGKQGKESKLEDATASAVAWIPPPS